MNAIDTADNTKAGYPARELLMTTNRAAIEFFKLTDADGHIWIAPRQALAGGNYRTPDDPTTREGLPTAVASAANTPPAFLEVGVE